MITFSEREKKVSLQESARGQVRDAAMKAFLQKQPGICNKAAEEPDLDAPAHTHSLLLPTPAFSVGDIIRTRYQVVS